MFTLILSAALAIGAVQSPSDQPASRASNAPITALSQLPLQEAGAPRCGIVFAATQGLQQAGDARAKQWPDMAENNGREFFVRAFAKLMEDRGLTKEQVNALVSYELNQLSQDDYKRVHDLMEPCLLMKRSAGL